jgi:hypothetical protein
MGGVVARHARMIGRADKQAHAEGHKPGTADLAQRHSTEAT